MAQVVANGEIADAPATAANLADLLSLDADADVATSGIVSTAAVNALQDLLSGDLSADITAAGERCDHVIGALGSGHFFVWLQAAIPQHTVAASHDINVAMFLCDGYCLPLTLRHQNATSSLNDLTSGFDQPCPLFLVQQLVSVASATPHLVCMT